MSYIEKNTSLTLVAQCYNAIEALHYLRTNSVDLLFLDINMPEISGIEFLKTLTNKPKTILTTAYSQYALESYEYGVIDYLLKPISLSRFIKSIERFFSLYKKETPEEPENIDIKVDGYNITLKQNEIDYIQSHGNYVKVFTRTKVFLVSTTTQEIISNLSTKQFMRIHKSYIVNITKITKHTDGHVFINTIKLPIGITYKRELLQRLVH